MRRSLALLALLALAQLGACASSPPAFTPAAPRTAWIIAADGHRLGQASFTEAPHGVFIRVEITERGLAQGWHGLHLHQRGDCSDFARGFQASGSHLGMDERRTAHRIQHGLMNPAGPEAGDLPNLHASFTAPYATEIFSPYVTLGAAPGRAPLLDADGSALIIHANPDDQVSQPVGNAGDRTACAALTNLP